MQSFKTSKSHIAIQGLLLTSLIFFTLQQENINGDMHLPIMIIVDSIAALFFVSSFIRKVTINNNEITVYNYMRSATVDLNNITYAQSMNAIARWVIIVSDSKNTVMLSSLIDNLDKIVDIINLKLPNDEKDKLLQTVQVKSSGCKTISGHYQVALKSCGGTKGTTYKTFKDTFVDLLFVFLKDCSMYLIPAHKINNSSTITLTSKYSQFKIKLLK